MKTCKVIAPAKVNLFLGIGKPREDGFHDVMTVMHALSMHDTLQMCLVESGEHVQIMEENDPAQPLRQAIVKVEEGQGLQVVVRNLWSNAIEPMDIPSEDNLACKAVRNLAEELGRTQDETIRIVIEKHIPYQAGLGGGSSDAAAAILGAANMWGVPAEDPAVDRAARRTGADVSFFIHGGCALMTDRGDCFAGSLQPRRDSVVVVKPEGGVSTGAAYRLFDEAPDYFTQGDFDAIRAAGHAEEVRLGNNLQKPAQKLLPIISDAVEFVRASEGVRDVLLCGSGSAVFAPCESYEAAQALVARASLQGYWARATTFSGIRAAVMPARR
ncbi:MAG: hypothetical protein MSA55_04955 [Coriobacteriaceae bacterium]|nr:hypothetical protein [Coriobacteriaceae bacterium]